MHPTNYFTPIKTAPHYHRQLFNSDSLHRQGDWLCLNCQNINYSFRKICNRCKTQSRNDNDQHSVYSYYYYNNNNNNNNNNQRVDCMNNNQIMDGQEYTPLNCQRNPHSHKSSFNANLTIEKQQNKENYPIDWSAVMETPKKKNISNSPNTSKLDGLPSVSPLVKKYRLKQHHTTLEKLKEHTTPNAFQLSNLGKQFQSIKIRDFDELILDLNFTNGSKNEIEGSPFKDNSEEDDIQGHKFMKEIEQSISRIII